MALNQASDDTTSPHPRAANDAFGKTSPHWNLPFHAGNATAAEILTYLPHWLKSVDVINRFVMNGGKAKVISSMLNKFRYLPGKDGIIQMNSVCVMMQCAMRAFRGETWTAGTHYHSLVHPNTDFDPTSLNVSEFRTPHITHPKGGSKKRENVAARPIQFHDLAEAVKEHPSDDDALDLTRCVLYAIDHPEESWCFPDDFSALVNHLGGPSTPSHSHTDTQAFQRHLAEASSVVSRQTLTPVTPFVNNVSSDTTTQANFDTTDQVNSEQINSDTTEQVNFDTTKHANFDTTKHVSFDTTNIMVSARNSNMLLASPKKRGYGEFSSPPSGTAATGGKRRSGRLATQALKDLREPDSDGGTCSKYIDTYEPPQKKRKSARASSVESEFTGNYTSDSESLPDANDDTSDDFLASERKRPARASAMKGRRLTQKAIYNEMPKTPRTAKGIQAYTYTACGTHMSAVPATDAAATVPDYLIDPALLGHAHDESAPYGHVYIDPVILSHTRDLEARAPIEIPAPLVNHDRLVIDEHNIWLYAGEGCTTRDQMWASALSSQRFNNGPRIQAPFRELYRLSDPDPQDMSDWAENIRWAKEQYLYFAVDTWTEYDQHLEMITQWRREHGWWSEQAITSGVYHYKH
jgi:hypothetical protein